MSYLLAFLRWLIRHLPAFLIRFFARLLFSKSWRRFQEAVKDPREAQRKQLMAIVERNRFTEFGREHGFDAIESIEDFQRAVPIRGWEEFEPYVEPMVNGKSNVLVADQIPYFGLSSGTTGKPKYVAMPDSYIEEFDVPRRVWKRSVAVSFPGFARGETLLMSSPKIEGRTPGGTPYGSIYRRLDEASSRIAQETDPFPRAIYLLDDFDSKYYCLLRLASEMEISLISAVNPSTIILFCKKLNEFAERLILDVEQGALSEDLEIPDSLRRRMLKRCKPNPRRARRLRRLREKQGELRPVDVWPKLCGILTWKGGSAPFYLEQFPRWFDDTPVMDQGFCATEGSFNLPLSPEGSAGPVAVLGHFLEFVPVDSRQGPRDDTLLADELEVGQEYFIIITGSHGLYRYDINDVVRCTGYLEKTAMIEFRHKGGNMLSLTGEKVAESHVVEAFSAAAGRLGVELAGFAVTQDLDRDPPGYRFSVEPAGELPEARRAELLAVCEEELRKVNIEYEAKRDSMRLGPPELLVLGAGSFEGFRARRVADGAPDAHVKPPHLQRDPAFPDQFEVVARLIAGG